LFFGANGLTGIIIEPTELEPGQFRRIGEFDVQSPDGREFTKAMKSPSCVAGLSVYAGVVEINEYAEIFQSGFLQAKEYVENLQMFVVMDHGEKLYLFTDKQYIITLI
jgi:hypothetical protein